LILAGAAVFFVLGACGVGSVATYLLWPRTPVQVVNAPLAKQQPIIEVKKPPVIEEKKTETTKRVPNFGPNKAPETKVVGNTLDAKRRYPRDIDEFATSLNDVTLRKIVPSIYTHTPLWHPDGKSLYVVQLHSHIMRLDAEDFSILKDRIYYEDKKPVYIRGGLTHSSEGLLALGSVDHALKGEDIHLIILDPETFLPAKKIPCPNAGLVLSAPNLSIAFVGGKNTYSDGGKQGDLRIVNLKSGAVEKLDLGFDFNPQSFQVSPDGQAFFGTDGKSLVRFRIDGGKLAHVDTSAVLVDNNQTEPRVGVSPDGSSVWLLGIDPMTERVPANMQFTLLDARNLKRGLRSLGFPVSALAFDPRDQSWLFSDSQQTLVFLTKGPLERIPFKMPRASQIVVRPNGGAALLHCGPDLYHVHWLPKAGN